MTRALVESHAKSAKPFEPIERERVLERMERASRRRVAVLAAPAGFGKSTALRQHLVRTKTTYVQFTVRKEHATLLDFVRGLAGALAPFVPSAGKSVAGAYQSAARSKNKAGALAHWLALLLRESEGTIVIDDLHAALGDEQVALLVAQLIDLTPEKLRWILSTRDASNLPAATWFARGMADLPVDERDLRLTWEEALAISLRWNSGATEVTVGELFALTGGWPTAFAFALAVSSRTTDLEKVALGTREMIYSYFAEQVFRDLSESDRE
ncbi:MAG TPA: AAA family ATPase, partial [Candidatus Baltobacteraceae bacterium]|nr:AAA family ATPase [Candidatus Baltobacteraceae bacterium]